MLPPHIRRPADAVFWIDAWLVSLGGEVVPGEYEGVAVIESAPAVVIAVQVGELRVHFSDGSELVVNVRLASDLQVIKYTFDLIDQVVFGAGGGTAIRNRTPASTTSTFLDTTPNPLAPRHSRL